MRRELWETVVDLVAAVRPVEGVEGIRVTSLYVDLPIEVLVRRRGDELEVLADMPRWRWTTDFDEPRGRLRLVCREGGAG